MILMVLINIRIPYIVLFVIPEVNYLAPFTIFITFYERIYGKEMEHLFGYCNQMLLLKSFSVIVLELFKLCCKERVVFVFTLHCTRLRV